MLTALSTMLFSANPVDVKYKAHASTQRRPLSLRMFDLRLITNPGEHKHKAPASAPQRPLSLRMFEMFFCEPEGFFFRMNGAFGLGFGDGFEQLADDGAGL